MLCLNDGRMNSSHKVRKPGPLWCRHAKQLNNVQYLVPKRLLLLKDPHSFFKRIETLLTHPTITAYK